MSEKQKVRLELLQQELETVAMMRRRAKDCPLKAIVAGERELELKEEIRELKGEGAAA
jgi:hypothetical protein